MKLRKTILLFILMVMMCTTFLSTTPGNAQVQTTDVSNKIRPGTWAAVDGLGRTVSSAAQVGTVKQDKTVGVFYWIWHNYWGNDYPARNITQIMSKNPETRNDFEHSAWEGTADWTPYFWDQPLLGYYRTTDKYVLRKHAEMLADADVDVIIFDCSNGTRTFGEGYQAVFKVFQEAKEAGVDVPQIAFLLNFFNQEEGKTQITQLYKQIYNKDKYKDLWFLWEGKPLIMAQQEMLNTNVAEEKAIHDFFTFRYNVPTYFDKDYSYDKKAWGWCSVYPQTKFGVRKDGSVEQLCVSAAQNARQGQLVAMNDYRGGVQGRGYAKGDYSYQYTYQNNTITVNKNTKDAYIYGLNFQQQWDYALEVNPDFIFVTGWNEYVVSRLSEWMNTPNGFSDNFDAEYSRDIEPSAGVLKDHFYYQLVENIRRYKGADVQEAASVANNAYKTIDITDSQDSWADVTLVYNHYTGSTIERNCVGYKGTVYKSNTMRNDIVQSKVAYDENNIYFMVETKDNLSAFTDPAWMRLLIDTDPTGVTANWEGFEYILNRVSPSGNQAILEKSTGGWNFEQVGTVSFAVKGKRLQVAIPKTLLGFTGTDAVQFNFKWADNTRKDGATQDSGDILDFYQYGDVAPGGRFMFTFTSTEVELPEATPTKTPVQSQTQAPTAGADQGGSQGGNQGGNNMWLWVAVVVVVVVVAVVVVVVIASKKKE